MQEETKDAIECPLPVSEGEQRPEFRRLHDAITVVETVTFHPIGANAIQVDCRFSKECATAEIQPYNRLCKAGNEWRPLDLGWILFDHGIESVGMIYIVNSEGLFLQTNPTDEERKLAAERILELSFGGDDQADVLIPPQESFRARIYAPNKVMIRCKNGPCKYAITVLPK